MELRVSGLWVGGCFFWTFGLDLAQLALFCFQILGFGDRRGARGSLRVGCVDERLYLDGVGSV